MRDLARLGQGIANFLLTYTLDLWKPSSLRKQNGPNPRPEPPLLTLSDIYFKITLWLLPLLVPYQ